MVLIKIIKVQAKDEETRIDRWLKRNFSSLNQNIIEKNLRKGLIKVNHIKVKANYKVVKNDIVNIAMNDQGFHELSQIP